MLSQEVYKGNAEERERSCESRLCGKMANARSKTLTKPPAFKPYVVLLTHQ